LSSIGSLFERSDLIMDTKTPPDSILTAERIVNLLVNVVKGFSCSPYLDF
jgi:hypothetical protein